MSITTKRGDGGKTSLLWGGRVSKDDLRVETCGTLDELCSFLGSAKSLLKGKSEKDIVESIQEDLFTIGAEVASKPQYIERLKERVDRSDVIRLEKIIDKLESCKSPKARRFCLPGRNIVSSSLDICRTIARRAERQIVTLARKKGLRNEYCVIYLNRASDLLYLLARSCDKNRRGDHGQL